MAGIACRMHARLRRVVAASARSKSAKSLRFSAATVRRASCTLAHASTCAGVRASCAIIVSAADACIRRKYPTSSAWRSRSRVSDGCETKKDRSNAAA
eukprot:6205451-Pleurochrysis_carterae.AAC.5